MNRPKHIPTKRSFQQTALQRKVITQILFSVSTQTCGCNVSFDDKPEQTIKRAHYTPSLTRHTHRASEYPNIYLRGSESDWTLRCLSKRADVSALSPALLPETSANISDTGEMGASTPAVTVILGLRAFHLVPTGSGEMLCGNIGMLYIHSSLLALQDLHPCGSFERSRSCLWGPNAAWNAVKQISCQQSQVLIEYYTENLCRHFRCFREVTWEERKRRESWLFFLWCFKLTSNWWII